MHLTIAHASVLSIVNKIAINKTQNQMIIIKITIWCHYLLLLIFD